MAYKHFTQINQVLGSFNLKSNKKALFQEVAAAAPSEWLTCTLEIGSRQPRVAAAERSARIVSPILAEICQRNDYHISACTGSELDADLEAGLCGEFDYFISRGTLCGEVIDPFFSIVQTGQNNLEFGAAQCLAQMMGAKLHNESEDFETPRIYGATTNGFDWWFMKMEGSDVDFDDKHYHLAHLDELLGILQFIIDDCKIPTPQLA